MQSFIDRYSDRIHAILRGFDRLVFRGRFRLLTSTSGMAYFLDREGIRLTEFKGYVEGITESLKATAKKKCESIGREVHYLESAQINKEQVALKIAREENIQTGLIGVLSSVEPCKTYEVYRDKQRQRIDLKKSIRKCLHHYHYLYHPELGFMNARIQTWFPFDIQICINGREWLSRQMDREKIGYRRNDNCFTWLADPIRAQKLMDSQLKKDWKGLFCKIARQLNPTHAAIFKKTPLEYYWTVHQSEWASDIIFKKASDLKEIYGRITELAISHFSSEDVMRFLGKKVFPNFQGEIVSSFKNRPDGIRIKHWVGYNSIKLYDKAGNVLRPETTINDPMDLKVFRPKENDPNGEPAWRPMRKGIADLYRRAQYSQACNERYVEAISSFDTTTPLGTILTQLAKPTTWNGKRIRGINPWQKEDFDLLLAINRGEFKLNGFRNAHLQQILYNCLPSSAQERRKRSAKVTRQIRLLRAHHLIRKIPSTYRYTLTDKGTQIINTLCSLQKLTLQQIPNAA